MAKDKADISLDQISIMVIEDNEYVLDILINSLRNMGFKRLQKFQSGKEAVEHL
jgi:CheY-like chemotaxis protein